MCNKMSDVRLSNASPTLERVDPAGRIAGLGALMVDRPPVCRNLFGSPDPEDFQRECRAHMAEEQRRFAERWGFDVVAGRPLDVPPGGETAAAAIVWEEVSDAPDFYCRAPHERRRRPRRPADSNGNRSRGGGADDGGRDRGDDDDGPRERSPCRGGGGDSSPDSSPSGRRRQRAPGPCSGDSPRKRLRFGGDEEEEDDEDDHQSNCTTSQTLPSVEETPSKADSREQLG